MWTETEGIELVGKYWNAIYSGDHSELPEILADDIKVTILSPVEKTLTNKAELIEVAEEIQRIVAEKITSKLTIFCERKSIYVDFEHRLRLKTGNIIHSRGYQDWTVKLVDGKPVLASMFTMGKDC